MKEGKALEHLDASERLLGQAVFFSIMKMTAIRYVMEKQINEKLAE